MEKPMMIESEFMIKAYEIDSVGIVSNIVYIKWFEDLRHIFMDKYYPYKEMMKQKVSPVLVKTEAVYKAPLTITDSPLGRCWMTKLGNTKWEMHIEIVCGDTVHCTGIQSGCFYDVEKKYPTRTPGQLVEAYKKQGAK